MIRGAGLQFPFDDSASAVRRLALPTRLLAIKNNYQLATIKGQDSGQAARIKGLFVTAGPLSPPTGTVVAFVFELDKRHGTGALRDKTTKSGQKFVHNQASVR